MEQLLQESLGHRFCGQVITNVIRTPFPTWTPATCLSIRGSRRLSRLGHRHWGTGHPGDTRTLPAPGLSRNRRRDLQGFQHRP